MSEWGGRSLTSSTGSGSKKKSGTALSRIIRGRGEKTSVSKPGEWMGPDSGEQKQGLSTLGKGGLPKCPEGGNFRMAKKGGT